MSGLDMQDTSGLIQLASDNPHPVPKAAAS
jgi:hypothetical protein